MKIKVLFLIAGVLVFLLSSFGVSSAAVKAKGKVTREKLSALAGGDLVNLSLSSVASESGEIFVLVRDAKSKKRDLGWILYNPSANKIVKRGRCPFDYENKLVAISPNARYAAAFSRFPAALHVLDLKDSSWKRLYTNPAPSESGLSIFEVLGGSSTQDSPLFFLDDDTLVSVFHDMTVKDGEKTVKDLVSVFFDMSGKKGMEKGMTFSECLSAGEKAIKASGAEISDSVSSNDMIPVGVNKFVMVMKSGDKNFLVFFDNGEAKVIDSTSSSPMEFLSVRNSDGAVFYMVSPSNKNRNGKIYKEIKCFKDGEVSVVETGRIYGGIFPETGKMMIVKISESGRTYDIFVVAKPGKLERIASTTKSVRFGFGSAKNLLYLISPDAIEWVNFI